jgi:hypothetical protein
MKRRLPGFIVLILCASLAACGAGPDEDAIDDSFLTGGKADDLAADGPLARGVLKLANEASLEVLTDDVGLGSRVAGNIVDAREAQPFTTLAQLDAVPYVGGKAFDKLAAYAEANGYVPENFAAAQATRIPWSGYWWSMEKGELVLGWEDDDGRYVWTEDEVRSFDECLGDHGEACTDLLDFMTGDKGRHLSPLMKFDLYVQKALDDTYGRGEAPADEYTHASRWELDHHYIGDNRDHRFWDSRGYAGKCIGWALSTIDWDEPTEEVILRGIVFKPADIKGILAAIYNGAQFFVPEDQVLGNEYRDSGDHHRDDYYEDVYPHDFVRALQETIGQGKILEGDLDPGDGVWNYPIYRYEMSWTKESSTLVSVNARIFYANDEVEIDEVFSKNPARPDLLSRDLTFELDVTSRWRGDLAKAKGGRWTGESVDKHPDALIMGLEDYWREDIYEYEDTNMDQEVNFELIKSVDVDGGWGPIVDTLLEDYYRG